MTTTRTSWSRWRTPCPIPHHASSLMARVALTTRLIARRRFSRFTWKRRGSAQDRLGLAAVTAGDGLEAAITELERRLERLCAAKPTHAPNARLIKHLRNERGALLSFLRAREHRPPITTRSGPSAQWSATANIGAATRPGRAPGAPQCSAASVGPPTSSTSIPATSSTSSPQPTAPLTVSTSVSLGARGNACRWRGDPRAFRRGCHRRSRHLITRSRQDTAASPGLSRSNFSSRAKPSLVTTCQRPGSTRHLQWSTAGSARPRRASRPSHGSYPCIVSGARLRLVL